jgi:type I restriction enzyme M protein
MGFAARQNRQLHLEHLQPAPRPLQAQRVPQGHPAADGAARFDCLLAPTKARCWPSTRRSRPSPRRSSAACSSRSPAALLQPLEARFAQAPRRPQPARAQSQRYINGFSKNVREIMERFAFDQQIARMAEKNLLYEVIKKFAATDLSRGERGQHPDGLRLRGTHPDRRGTVERRGRGALHAARGHQADGQPAALAGEGPAQAATSSRPSTTPPAARAACCRWPSVHPRPQQPTPNPPVRPGLERRSLGRLQGGHAHQGRGRRQHRPRRHLHQGRLRPRRRRARNAPSTTCWPTRPSAWSGSSSRSTSSTSATPGLQRRFGAGTAAHQRRLAALPAAHAGQDARPQGGGSRIGIVFNGSPLFTGDAGSGESEHPPLDHRERLAGGRRRLPDQLFYNTGISTYIWVLTNRKEPRKGKVQLIDARRFFVQDAEKPRQQAPQASATPPTARASRTRSATSPSLFGNFTDGETRTFSEEDPITKQPVERSRVVSKVFDNEDFGFHKITVERPCG